MNILIELSTVIVEVFLPWYFFSGLFHKTNTPKNIKALIAVVYFITLADLSLFMPMSTLRSFTIMAITYLAAKFYFNKSWLITLYPTILFFSFSILSDILCGMTLQSMGISGLELMGDGIDRLIYIIFGKLIHLLCLYIVLTLVKLRVDSYSIMKSLPLLSCQLLSIYICQRNFLIVMEGNAPSFLHFENLSLLYINLIICAFVEILNRSHEREREVEITKQQLAIQRNHYLDIMERQEETRSLWHDIKKYMASMEALVSTENKDEAEHCLEDLRASFSVIENSVDTGNTVVDSILSYGMTKALEAGATINAEVWVDTHINFPATDLFVIMGNTLDNAIEACQAVSDKTERIINLELIQKNHVLFYEISNPYTDKTMKKPGKIHGYGLKNVAACVEKNNGMITISNENGTFTVSIQLNIWN